MSPGARGVGLMYHYVHAAPDHAPAGIRPFAVAAFEEQLDWLAERYEILDGPGLADVAVGRRALERPFCVLTFDDGTKDHATVVTPLLARRGLSGFFFLLSGPWSERRMPLSHGLHLLLSRLDERRLWSAVVELAHERYGRDAERLLGDEAHAAARYGYEDSRERMRIKYALNFALEPEEARALLRPVLVDVVGDESAAVDEWFVTVDEARAMEAAGMTIGTHGHSHTAFAHLDESQAAHEIETCHRTLARVLRDAPRWLAWPFGRPPSRSGRLDALLRELGYLGTFVYRPQDGTWADAGGGLPVEVNRIDCADEAALQLARSG